MKIFYDQTGQRWIKAKIIVRLLFGIWVATTMIFFLSLVISPTLNSLDWTERPLAPKSIDPAIEKVMRTVSQKDYESLTGHPRSTGPGDNVQLAAARNASSIDTAQAASIGYQNQTMAFLVNDENGLNSLQANLNKIDVIFPLWLELDKQTLLTKSMNPESIQRVKDIIAGKNGHIQVIPVLSNFDSASESRDSDSLQKLLNDTQAQTRLITDIKTFLLKNRLDGISLDLEPVAVKDQSKYISFVSNLKKNLTPNHLSVSVNLSFYEKDLDLKKLAAASDFIIVRAYNEHWLTSSAGTIASQKWIRDQLALLKGAIPPEKLVIGLGAVAYDWADGAKQAQTLSYAETVQLAKDSNSKIIFNDVNLNSNFEYYNNGVRHKVYLYDAVAAFNTKQLLSGQQPKGYAVWRLGLEDNSIWDVLDENSADRQLSAIQKISPIDAVDYQGNGDVMKVKDTPRPGERRIAYDSQSKLITAVDYAQYPSGYVIGRTAGQNQKEVAITFDDGPDPASTPKILDILRANNVKATFFIVGKSADKFPDLLKQIYQEGHLIGNHTYSHADISSISDEQLNLELNSTQMLLERVLGIKTILFRAPYDVDAAPQTLAQAKPIALVSQAGYVTVGISIDPKDWYNNGVDKIVTETIKQAEANQGGILLLHDGGGDREQTIQALPKIISGLREKGFKIVPLENMIGVTPDVINAPINFRDMIFSLTSEIYIKFLTSAFSILQVIILIALVLGLLRFLPIGILAYIQAKKVKEAHFNPRYHPKVSVVIAAYNEEKVIKETIENVLLSEYAKNKFEIIVVNDGSTDGTWEVLKSNYSAHHIVRIFNKKNGGKSAAVNFGVRRATGQIMVSIDADTLITPQTVKLLVRHFSNPKIGAVAGNAKVGNRANILTKFQALEYITSQNLDKRAFDMLNSITVVPGAIGAWRMKLIRKLGGLDSETLAEDSDLTLNIIRHGYIVHYEENGLAYTEAPMTLKALAAQRFRWAFGTLQVLAKNRTLIANPKYRWLGMLGLPNIIYFQFFSPIITPIVDLQLGIVLVIYLVQAWLNITAVTAEQFAGIFAVALIFNVFDLFSCFLAFFLEKRENWKLLLYLIPQRLFYRFFINWVCLKSLVSAVKGHAVGWNKLERTGQVKNEKLGEMVYNT